LYNNLLMVNLLSQMPHPKGLSPVWVLLCSFTVVLWANRRPQISQGYGFSPV
jgi:hypothetical protein